MINELLLVLGENGLEKRNLLIYKGGLCLIIYMYMI